MAPRFTPTSPTLRLRAELLAAIAPLLLATAACSDRNLGEREDVSTTADMTALDEGGSAGGSVCGVVYEGDEITVANYPGDCSINYASFGAPYVFTSCLDGAEDECEELCGSNDICGSLSSACVDLPDWDRREVCGPYYDPGLGACCSVTVIDVDVGGGYPDPDSTGEGRPFRPGCGSVRVASLGEGGGAGWSRVRAQVSLDLDGATRERLAAHWRRVALAEHASVASFARFVVQLQAVGAPPQLVLDALQAAGDEVRHARVAFGLAARFAGAPVEPGPLATRDGFEGVTNLAAAVRDAFLEGCVAETLSAHEIELAAEACEAPELRRAMLSIAADERRHAALAWRFVAWAVEAHPKLRAELTELVARVCAAENMEDEQSAAAEPSSAMSRLGCPSRPTRQRWRRVGLSQVVRPCAERLLAG